MVTIPSTTHQLGHSSSDSTFRIAKGASSRPPSRPLSRDPSTDPFVGPRWLISDSKSTWWGLRRRHIRHHGNSWIRVSPTDRYAQCRVGSGWPWPQSFRPCSASKSPKLPFHYYGFWPATWQVLCCLCREMCRYFHFLVSPIPLSNPRALSNLSCRPYVKSLVVDLKNVATWQSFQSFENAAQNYNKAKSLGLTRIRRVAGDDSIYGPECEGMQAAVLF